MRWKNRQLRAVGYVALAAVVGFSITACDPEIEQRDAPGEPFDVVFDPAAGVIPLPNTLALDADGTFPEAGTCEAGMNTAQGYFDDYLAQLSGWPAAAPITVHLSSEPDLDTIGDDDIQLWRSAGDGWERVSDVTVEYSDEQVDPCTGETAPAHMLEIVPGEGVITTHSEYFAFVSGEIQGENGSSLMASEPMYLALQPIELLNEDGSSAIDMLDDESAQGLQMIRNTIAPALEVIESETGFEPARLAAVWHWHTWDDTFAVFEPALADIPFPNDAIISDGMIGLPLPDENDPARPMLEALTQRDGFSKNAPGWFTLMGGVDESTVTHDSVVLGPEDGVSTVLLTEEEYTLSYEEAWGRVTFEPTRPLLSSRMYVAAVTTDIIGANGRPVQPTAPFVFLRNPHSLVDGAGESQISVLDNETAQQLEEGRQGFELLFTAAPMVLGKERGEIATAWVFTTEDPVAPMVAARDLVLDELDEVSELRAHRECEVEETDCEEDSHLLEVGATMEHPNDPTVDVAMENVSYVYTGGEFTSVPVDILEQTAGGEGERVGLSVFLPEQQQGDDECLPPYDVAIVQHGLQSDRNVSGVALANDLAAYPGCMATVAMDLPLHGGRAMGSDNPHPPNTPENSGEGFLSADFLTSKSFFVQGIMDLAVLSQIIQSEVEMEFEINGEGGNGGNGGNNENGNDTEFIDVGGLDGLFADLEGVDGPLLSDRIGYVGVSLGGVLGVPFAAIDPAVEALVINGAGGNLTWMLEGDEEGVSMLGQPILDALADEQAGPGIEPGDQEFFEAMLFVQWMADWVDPINFAATVGEEVDTLLQMVDGDRVIVNRTTEALADELGVELGDTTFEDVTHGFIFMVDDEDTDFDAGHCARLQAAAWLDSSLAGEGELPAGLSASECVQ